VAIHRSGPFRNYREPSDRSAQLDLVLTRETAWCTIIHIERCLYENQHCSDESLVKKAMKLSRTKTKKSSWIRPWENLLKTENGSISWIWQGRLNLPRIMITNSLRQINDSCWYLRFDSFSQGVDKESSRKFKLFSQKEIPFGIASLIFQEVLQGAGSEKEYMTWKNI